MNGYWRRCWGGRVLHYFLGDSSGGRATLCGQTLTPHMIENWYYSSARYPKCKKCLRLFAEAECTTKAAS